MFKKLELEFFLFIFLNLLFLVQPNEESPALDGSPSRQSWYPPDPLPIREYPSEAPQPSYPKTISGTPILTSDSWERHPGPGRLSRFANPWMPWQVLKRR